MLYEDRYNSWSNNDFIDDETKQELKNICNNTKEIEDRFYKDLEFGTAGLRGKIGAGTNRMNIYTVGITTQGLANYMSKWGEKGKEKGIVIAYDSRHKSELFAKSAALILCANGIKVYLFDSLRPVPVLSFSIKKLGCLGGIVITASHNPSDYNGYKVYWKEGYQLTSNIASDISEQINLILDFKYINIMEEEEAVNKGLLTYISNEIDEDFNKAVICQSVNKDMIQEKGKELSIVFSPLHGSGNIPVRKALHSIGFTNVNTVVEQEKPDGRFPTVEVPNPEDVSVFELPKLLAHEKNADVIIVTDPDADRVGVAYKDENNKYINLNGNQIGCLLENYLLNELKKQFKIPDDGVIIKSIVTTDLANKIAEKYNINVENTLTGFKYIGEKVEEYKNTKLKSFIMGFEESYGYLIGDHCRDKDAVVTSLLVCEMVLFYKTQNKHLGQILEEIYSEHGYYMEDIKSIKIEGKEGIIKLQRIANYFRRNLPMKWNNSKVKVIEDYQQGKRSIVGDCIENIVLPRSNVLKIYLEDESWFCIRPSGTEPKIKIYFSVNASSVQETKEKLDGLKEEVMDKAYEAQNPLKKNLEE
ncbi:MAG: phospho-sugar mutase [Eubacteriaceae bacterium]